MAKKYGPNRIAELRRQMNLTQEQLAERVGTNKQQIFKLEHGERKLTFDWMKRLAAALGGNIHWSELPGGGMALRPDQREVLAGYDELPEDGQRMIRTVIEAERRIAAERKAEAPDAAPAQGEPKHRTTGGRRPRYKAA